MLQECTICKVIKNESEFTWLNQHLGIGEDGSKITDPWDIVDDHKHHTYDKCRKEKAVKEFVIYG